MHLSHCLRFAVPVLLAGLLACASHDKDKEVPSPTAPPSEPGVEETSQAGNQAIEATTPTALAGSSWILVAWDVDEPAEAEPAVTVTFGADHISGTSGCNRYTAGLSTGDIPGSVTIGPVAGTKRMCAPEAMEVEQRFSSLLASVTSLGLRADTLVLTATVGGEPVSMRFERQE